MKDKGIKKVFHPFRTGIDRHMAGLRRRWLRLSCRQQKVVILYLLGLFAAIDLAASWAVSAEQTNFRLRYGISKGLRFPRRTVSNH